GHQDFALFGQMQQAGSAFEQGDAVIVEKRHLREGLAGEVFGAAVGEIDAAHAVIQPRLFGCPAQPDIAHMATRALRHPIISPDGQHARPYASRRISKPPNTRRLSSMSGASFSAMRGSSMSLGQAASRTALDGHSIQPNTTVSPGLAPTAFLKSVTLPSGTIAPQASTLRTAPCSISKSATVF